MSLASNRRSRVEIQKRSDTQDALGQPVEAWATVATVWAHIIVLSGLQTLKAGAETSVVKASIRVCYGVTAEAGMRVLHDGRVYGIQAVLPDVGRHEYTDLVVELLQ